ncbi:hypothetical protein EHQ81_06520 [Leptospira selangorensis]|uniref:Uncharacterized protein n=2 Tax=Leptospira selangorensis TaxID=2484982 RepID=A0A5F2BYX8_9LEPT|nr:hypothetical protein EHQ81_06520 [Leptospira selangorensis]TGM18015.1 hypothetical protein EHQ82_13185 [Leptospira selangorensis]
MSGPFGGRSGLLFFSLLSSRIIGVLGKKLLLWHPMKKKILALLATYLVCFSLFGQTTPNNQRQPKNQPTNNQQPQNQAPIGDTGSSSSSGNGSTLGNGLLHILELDGVAGSLNQGGPQSINGILNSVRIAGSALGGTPEFFKENSKTTPSGGFPKIRYSHQLSDNMFIGIVASLGEKSTTETTTTSTSNRYTTDKITTTTNEWKIKYGWGPLNLNTSNDVSYEFSIGYGQAKTSGDYSNFGIKLPGFSSGSSDGISGYAIGFGDLRYNITTISLDYGVAVPISSWMNWYFRGDTSFFWGTLSLSSAQIGIDTGSTAGAYNGLDFNAFKSKDGFFAGASGFTMTFETGFVVKPFETFGIRFGGFYQLTYFSVGEVKGPSISGGQIVEAGAVPSLSSTTDNEQFGNYGGTIGLVKNL